MELEDYDIREKIGEGPRSTVYRAVQRSLGRSVALKVLRRYDEESKAKFHREATITAKLNHPGIRKVFGAERTRQRGRPFWYIVMDYVEDSLQTLLGPPLDEKRAAGIAADIAGVLQHVHEHDLAHLDVKPGNILISHDGQVLLSDFGIARPVGETTREGTPLYMSPEQARGEPVRPASDVYSLGVVLYEMLTGRPPFRAENDLALRQKHADRSLKPRPPRELNPKLSPDAERIVLKALEKDPDQRYATAAELANQLRTLATQRSTSITTILTQVPKPAWFVTILIPILLFAIWSSVVGKEGTSTATPAPSPTDFQEVLEATDTPITVTARPLPSTAEPSEQPARGATVTLKPPGKATATLVSTTPTAEPQVSDIERLCPNPDARITSPEPGAEISGDVEIRGTASFAAGSDTYYTVTWRRVGESPKFIVMGQTHSQPVINGRLEFWRIGGYPPGAYEPRLVVEVSEETESCTIQVAKVNRE